MIERLLILLTIAFLFVAGYYALRGWQAWQLRTLRAAPPAQAGSPLAGALGAIVAGGPALLYFTTETCAQCRFQQTPILQELQKRAATPPVITLDALQRQDLARHFGIMTVPSTVLLDGRRVPVAINHGVTPLQKLQAQIASIQ